MSCHAESNMRHEKCKLSKSVVENEKSGDSNTDVSFNSCTEVLFHLVWRQIFQCAMRSFGIVKLNIGSYTGFEMLYRKDDLSGRVLFSTMRRMILRPRYHAACRAEKRIASYCIYAKAVETGERYIAPTVAMKNKTRWGMAFFMRHFKCCSEKLGAVLFETLCAITLREKRSIITQI